MPRSVNPGDILVGKGRAPQGTVEDNSLRNPDRDVLPLNAHIHDPSRAHFAVSIAIEDVANNFSSDEVEGALAELAGSGALGRTNGLLSGGTFTDVGTTITLDATNVLLNGTDQDFTGASVVLPAAGVHYVYADPGTGLLAFTTGAPPPFVGEPVLFWEITTAAGSVTGSRDARFFVLNIDRKPPFTLRSDGAAGNANSEGAFESLTAALLYLEMYAAGGTSAEIETHRILVRGDHVVSSTMTLPVTGVILEGDGDARFLTGAVVQPMFNVPNDRCEFRNLTFVSDHATSWAIQANGDYVKVIGCNFLAGGGTWSRAIHMVWDTFPDPQPPGLARGAVVRDCVVNAVDEGIRFGYIWDTEVSHCQIAGTNAASSKGVLLGDGTLGPAPAGVGRGRLMHCTVTDFEGGIEARHDKAVVADSVVNGARFGIFSFGDDSTVQNCKLTMSATTGETGIQSEGLRSLVTGCTAINPRAVWAAESPTGIFVTGGPIDSRVTNCIVEGFFNTANGLGFGIESSAVRGLVSGCKVDRGQTGIRITGDDAQIANCQVSADVFGIQAQAERNIVSECQVFVTEPNGRIGVSVSDPDTKIVDCHIENLRTTYVGADFLAGVIIQDSGVLVSGNTIRGFLNTFDTTGRGVYLTGTISNVKVIGNEIEGARNGVECASSVNGRVKISGNTISGVSRGVEVVGGADSIDYEVSKNNIFQEIVDYGIIFAGLISQVSIEGNTIDGRLGSDPDNPTATGIFVGIVAADVPSHFSIRGNLIQRCSDGIVVAGSLADPIVDVSIEGNTVHHCGRAQDLTTGPPPNAFSRWPAGIGVIYCTDVLIAGNSISKIGILVDNAGVESFPDQGGLIVDSQSVGINAWNTNRLSVKDNRITDTMSNNTAVSRGIIFVSSSSGVAPGSDFTTEAHALSDNEIVWSTGLAGNGEGDLGIQILVERGSDDPTSDHFMRVVQVRDNIIRNSGGLGIDITAGTGGIFGLGDVVGNNVAYNNLTGGVGIRAFADGGNFASSDISDNRISSSGSHGIHVLADSTGGIEDVDLRGNYVLLPVNGSDGIRVEAIGASIVEFKSIHLHNNLVNSATANGIYIRSEEFSLEDFSVTHCRVEGATAAGLFVETVPAVTSTQVDVTNFKIEGCHFESSGIAVNVVVNGTWNSVAILDTYGSVDAAVRVVDINATYASADTQSFDLLVSDCEFDSTGTGSEFRVRAAGTRMKNVMISNVTAHGSVDNGIHVHQVNSSLGSASPSLSNVEIRGCHVRDCNDNGILVEHGGDQQTVDGVLVSENVVDTCNTVAGVGGIYLLSGTDLTWRNLTISNNQVISCGHTEGLTTGSIAADIAQQGLANFLVTDNVMRDGTGTGFRFAAAGSPLTLENFEVSRNLVKDHTNTGVYLDLNLVASGNRRENVRVDGNTIHGINAAVLASGEHDGIRVVTPGSGTLNGLSISNNSITQLEEQSSAGIFVDVQHSFKSMTISQNQIYYLTATGSTIRGIFVNAPSLGGNDGYGLSMVGNSVDRAELSTTAGDAYILQLDLEVRQFVFNGNSAAGFDESFVLLVDGTGGSSISNSVISGNAVDGDIRYTNAGAATTDPRNVCIGNTTPVAAPNTWTQEFARWTTASPVGLTTNNIP
jgi:hypothetical protein